MKYQSELIKEIVDKRGHKFPSLHYQSECVESWIEEAKGNYPKLCDYEGEWLNYIVESPIGEFPYVTLTDVTEATVNNVVPYAYKSAILKGQTLVNISSLSGEITIKPNSTQFIESSLIQQNKTFTFMFNCTSVPSTGFIEFRQILDNTALKMENINVVQGYNKFKVTTVNKEVNKFRLKNDSTSNTDFVFNNLLILDGDYINIDVPYFEGMQSVKMPGLTTAGKNLFPDITFSYKKLLVENTGEIISVVSDDWACEDYLIVPHQKTFYTNMLYIGLKWTKICFYDENKNYISSLINDDTINFPENAKYWRVGAYAEPQYGDLFNQVMFCKSLEEAHSTYEPYKSNILTINEDVTLRSNGDICDELNLLTGQLTQRIGEDGVVLSQEVVKTVDLSVSDQDGNTLTKIKPIEGTMHLSTDGETIKPTFTGEIPVEAITQNLASFIEE